jgi:phosphoribosylanthranilate isomerase
VRTRVKFCGCTSERDAHAAVELGVDAIGVIFAEQSPRRVSVQTAEAIVRAVPAFISLVGVFVEPAPSEIGAACAAGFTPQFSGEESAWLCEQSAGRYIKVFHVRPDAGGAIDPDAFARLAQPYTRATWMFDTVVDGKYGGTGRTFDWDLVRAALGDRPVIVSGGLTPENVGDCIRALRPLGVDVRSGIETGGVKDVAKMRAFVRAVKEADAQT